MISQMSHVMTLANSIIGVSVLAMPFCFKQCGIVLAVLMLLMCSVLSRLTCHFLIKSAVISRRRNFELLAFHAFGHMGKFLVELFIIGFLLGTCIAFFVVVGDLGPQIIGKMINKTSGDIRTSLLIITSVFIVLPLGLLRNIDSLSSICTATIIFYLCLVLKVIAESTQHIFAGDWYDDINYWRPAGILQCLPIFSMALFCQTQLFEIYETIPNVSLEKMNNVVRGALNICTLVYICVGLFGYIAFCTQSFTGNILLSFEPSILSEMIKMGFVFSVAFSFPLVIFPCRASLNSLLFRRAHTHESSISHLSESRFRCLTIIIVGISLIVGILVPNIEFVLGIVGSTIGVIICVIFPAVFFISISNKNTNERLLAQGILVIGVWIMILGTYANLYALEQSTNTKIVVTDKRFDQLNNLPLDIMKDDLPVIPDIPNNLELFPEIKEKINKQPELDVLNKALDTKVKDIRQEPPIPVERVIVSEKPKDTDHKIVIDTVVSDIKEKIETIKTSNENLSIGSQIIVNADAAKLDPIESATLKAEEKIKIIEEKEKSMNLQKNDNLINLDAIKKEDSELAADGDIANVRAAERHEQLRKTLEKHKLEQRQMMQEQKEILKDIKEQKQEFEREKQRMVKDDIFKQSEKELQSRENILLENKDILIDSNRKVAEVNEINIVKKIVENGKEDEKRDIANNIELSKTLQVQHKNNDISIPTVNEKKKLTLPQELSKNRNVEVQKAAGKSLPIKQSNNELPEKLSKDEEKIARIEFNDSDSMKGPILNILSKGVLQKSTVEDRSIKESNNDLIREEKREIFAKDIIKASEKLQEKYDGSRYSMPLAWKIMNQSKIDHDNHTILSLNNSEPVIHPIHRDILGNSEREKRDVSAQINTNNTKIITHHSIQKSESHQNINAANNATCSKLNGYSERFEVEKENKRTIKTSTTEASLIKINVYLTEQGITKTNLMETDIVLKAEYVNMKKRDLKALNPKDNIEI